MAWPAIIAAIAAIGGSVIAAKSQDSATENAGKLIQRSIQDFEDMGIPSVEAQSLALEELQSQGVLTPELEQTIMQGNSAIADVATDIGYKDSQMQALDSLQDIGESGGMRLSDTANMENVLSDVRQSERGSREAIMANSRARGTSGSGSELAAQLQANQAGATNAYSSGMQVASNAQDRALQAIMQGGQMAGDMRGQDYEEQFNAAKASDEIDRFNALSQQDTQTSRVNTLNQAQASNLGNTQRIADANVGLRNQQQAHNKGLLQTQFENESSANIAKANARNKMGSNITQAGSNNAAMWGQVGQGVNQMGTAYASNQNQQRQAKDAQDSDNDNNKKKSRLTGGIW